MRYAFAWIAFCATACGPTNAAAPSSSPDWMAGYWLSCEGGETAESWIGAGANVLVGATLTRGARPGYEFLRIAPNGRGGFSYFAMPEGRSPPTEFTMVSDAARRAVFENLEHDFPQRIIYERTGDQLHARIEDAGAQRGVNYRFRLRPHDARCEVAGSRK
jgi:hypothetical protein